MTPSRFAERSPGDRFIDAMAHGLDAKIRQVEPDRALKLITEAYKIAAGEGARDPLIRAYRLIAAYRLAHLHLQIASSGQSETDVQTSGDHAMTARAHIEKAVEKFEEAGNGTKPVLGPMPHIYLTAALRRLKDMEATSPGRAAIDRRIMAAIDQAIGVIRDYGRPAPFRGRPDNELVLPQAKDNASLPIAQGPVVNLLELASYFLGIDYGMIRGLRDGEGDPCEGLIPGSSYVILGHDAHEDARGERGSSLRVSSAIADDTLKNAAKRKSHHLVFKLPMPGQGYPEILLPCEETTLPKHFDALHLIALLAHRPTSPSAPILRRILVGWKADAGNGADAKNQTDQAVSVAKTILEKAGSDTGGLARKKVLLGTPKEGLAINADIKVLVAVDATILANRDRAERRGHDV